MSDWDDEDDTPSSNVVPAFQSMSIENNQESSNSFNGGTEEFKSMTFSSRKSPQRDFGSKRGGFGGGRGGGGGGSWGRRNGGDDAEGDSSDNRRGGFRERRGGGFGGGRDRDNGDRKGGFGGNRDGEDGERKGFGGRDRGFGGGRDRENGDRKGFGGGFGGNRDSGDGERRGGFGGRDRDNGDRKGGFGGGFGGNRDSGDGERRGGFGGGFGGNRDDDDGERKGGFGDRGGGFGSKDGANEDGKPKREIYVPPPPADDENSIFETIKSGINFDQYDNIPVRVTGRDPPNNISMFKECGFYSTTRDNIAKCKYTKPTPVQKYAIPIVMGGRDLMACAQTGSGKTAAFLLPTITRLIKEDVPGASQGDSQSPDVLIISPTRELTLQIYNEARKFTHDSIYRPVVIYGGTSVGYQLRQVEGGCNILVCTPGRLLDFLQRKKVMLEKVKTFILDEADRMLDMGFGPEIRKVVENFNLPGKGERQTLMFSATFPEEIQQLAADFLHDYLFLTVGQVGGATTNILQKVVEVEEFAKREKLVSILHESGTDRVLVFVETKRNADFIASYLSQEGFPTTSIHGDRFQKEREEALRDFRSGRAPVMVATSVAARGLDIPEVKHVINYDLPQSIDEYVHRIGRTGRIGNKGQATAFFQKGKDSGLARSLVKILGDAEQTVPDFLEECAELATGTNYGPEGGQFASKDIRNRGGGRSWDNKPSGGGFGGFGESTSNEGGFSNTTPSNNMDDDWD